MLAVWLTNICNTFVTIKLVAQSINQYAFISNMTIARLLQYLEVIKRIHKNLH